jgi:hypothetical protein
MYSFLTVTNWADYELIDSGNFEKLERFGLYILAGPSPRPFGISTCLPPNGTGWPMLLLKKKKAARKRPVEFKKRYAGAMVYSLPLPKYAAAVPVGFVVV